MYGATALIIFKFLNWMLWLFDSYVSALAFCMLTCQAPLVAEVNLSQSEMRKKEGELA